MMLSLKGGTCAFERFRTCTLKYDAGQRHYISSLPNNCFAREPIPLPLTSISNTGQTTTHYLPNSKVLFLVGFMDITTKVIGSTQVIVALLYATNAYNYVDMLINMTGEA